MASLDYLDEEFDCEPIKILHKSIRDECFVDNYLDEFNNSKRLLELSKQQQKRNILKNHLNLLEKKILFITLNFALYDHIKNELSLGIFIIVNTIGVIVFIILSYEGAIVEPRSRDGKLASFFGAKKSPHAKLYQLIGAMGVIINISMIAAQFLEQVI